MLSNLFAYLKHEQILLEEMVELAQRLQKALVKFDTVNLEDITTYQAALAKGLREAEEQRINLLMAWLNISKAEAASLRLSSIESHLNQDEIHRVRLVRKNLRELVNQLQQTNTTNRLLANRGRASVREILSIFTNGNNVVCNVKV
ncbi:MAG: flagellar protein FlgN [Ignavibacteria bacterium]|nr:flagellar protein FlgN [Ignavibacteria bacterium]